MIDKRLFQLPGIKSLFPMLAGLTVLQAFMILLQAKFLATALVISWQRQSLSHIIQPTIFFIMAFLMRHFLTWVKDAILDKYATQTTENIRADLLDKIYTTGPQMIAQNGSGNMVTNALDGMDEINNYLNLILSKFMNMMIIPWIILIYIFFKDVTSGIVLVLVFPIIILFMIILGYAARDKANSQYAEYIVLSNHFLDALRGLTTLKMLGLSKEYAHNIYTVSEQYRKKTLSTLRIAILSTFALDWFTTLSIAILAVFLGLALMKGAMPLYPAMVTLILAPEYFLPLRNFANDFHATLNGKNAFNATMKILALPTTKQKELLTDFTWSQDSTLQLSQINFQYEGQKQPNDLRNISIDIQGYQKIAIVGQSGAGKSTLLDIISGFLIPQSGEVILNGQKLPHLGQNNWQTQFTYLPQKPYLFSDTIANNIRFYSPTASNEAVIQAVQQAGLTEFIRSLPQGLETKVGQGGRGISGGQAQRIMLARSFLASERHVLLFDEPTAHLDIETEYALKQTMLPLFDDHLVIFATHRLHWLQQMDYILVMEHGQIVEQGPVEQLLQEQAGPFYELSAHMRGDQ